MGSIRKNERNVDVSILLLGSAGREEANSVKCMKSDDLQGKLNVDQYFILQMKGQPNQIEMII